MNWLKAIVEGLFNALFKWGQDQAEKPKTTQDANTPPEIADRNAAAYRKWMRDKQGNGN